MRVLIVVQDVKPWSMKFYSTFVERLKNMTVEELCDVQLECRTSAACGVKWRKRGADGDFAVVESSANDKYQVTTSQGTVHRLVITGVTKDDAGCFMCLVVPDEDECTQAEICVTGLAGHLLLISSFTASFYVLRCLGP
jgi:hypothetical protein